MFLVTDEVTKDYHTLIHFTPTTKERQAFAKRGVAMPDGSFYIRNGSDLDNAIKAVGRATPNAGESEVARRNSIRRHIIKRASDLGMADKIPDTWNSDGSLKQSAILVEEVEEFLQHFGRKGMKWGEHRFGRDEGGGEGGYSKHPAGGSSKSSSGASAKDVEKRKALHDQAKAHDKVAAENATHALRYQKEAADLEKNGLQSIAFKRVYGEDGTKLGEWAFYGKYRQSKSEALGQTYANLRRASNIHSRMANSHSKKAVKLRAKADKIRHSDDAEEFIAHFGRKGMKWGEHIFGDHGGSSSPGIHPDAAKAAASLATARKHGSSALSTQDLRNLNNRLQQEQQFSRLTTKQKSEGRKFVAQYARQSAVQHGPKLIAKGAAWVARHYAGLPV